MIIHLRNKKEIKCSCINAITQNEIDVIDTKDNVIQTISLSELDYITNNRETESLVICDKLKENGEYGYIDCDISEYEFVEQYQYYDDELDKDIERENIITFKSLSEFDEYVFNEFSKPYMHFENEPTVTW